MSNWTHIVATIDVDTYIEDKNIKERIEDILKDAPKITGSESDTDIFINVLSGHNMSTNCDCNHCEYKDTIVHHENGGYSCETSEGYECPEAEYQTRVVITVIGDLRDRVVRKTAKEYCKFYSFLEEKFYIRNSTFKIID